MGKTVFLLLAGCSAEFSLAAAVEVESDAAVDAAALEAAAVDRGSADAALSDAAVTPDAAHDIAAPVCDPGFPDGGWHCGPSWVNAPNTFICVSHAGQQTTLSAAGNCQDGCVSCATCDLAKACRTFDGGVGGCSDVGGRFVVQCNP